MSGRTLARLASPFDSGGGPSHSSIERIWIAEDAFEYLPEEGNKADRVLGGLKALRDGRRPGGGRPGLPPDQAKLSRIASELGERLLIGGFATEEDLAEVLGPSDRSTSPGSKHGPDTQQPAASPAPGEQTPLSTKAPIFVVHGQDRALLHEVVRMLERSTTRDIVVLHEQPNAGRTLLEKFEAHAAAASFAVILLTGDDIGGTPGEATARRGRQNVIFELGFFFGKLGRDRVAVLLGAGVEQPSDIAGLVYIPADSAGAWKQQLAREIDAAGIEVAYDHIP